MPRWFCLEGLARVQLPTGHLSTSDSHAHAGRGTKAAVEHRVAAEEERHVDCICDKGRATAIAGRARRRLAWRGLISAGPVDGAAALRCAAVCLCSGRGPVPALASTHCHDVTWWWVGTNVKSQCSQRHLKGAHRQARRG
ncbi:hypothetical protein COCMIDRAFT_23778 [Bipolaris oryzae ATCC 44560]|uniref:Uncharacterized protein n=1 Tax=Bipolaris oryzae ATCC 44560 TaxID=930090 RepID=W6ZX38_COCMI|nr:uncharacterized protein COCMIDRAFT_23778 [Bipolaris oryzae ATCC 44560]EUC48411.1 hypothetical protein COCMIDRAFT_23778 [Bipolaris oryzae ATCC 44560]